MATLLLVHGSFHGAWCFDRLRGLLAAQGHTVLAPNLPASGGDPAPIETANLHSYATRIATLIDEQPEPVVLVAHSMGGIVASQAAEWRADRVKAIVYISGLLLRNGETLAGFLAANADLGVKDMVLENMQVSADGSIATMPAAAAPGVFYNLCSEADAAAATARLTPQATAVYADPLSLTDANFGRIPRAYVECLQDHAVDPRYQRIMVENTPCRVFSLDADHSPFLSRPEQLAGIIADVVDA